MSASTSARDVQQSSAKLRRILSGLLVALALLVVLERFGAMALEFVLDGLDASSLQRFTLACVSTLPEGLYLAGLWWIRQALAEFAAGKPYSSTTERMIDRVGTMLAAGALVSVLLVPGISRALGSGPGYLIAHDVAAVVLGATGLALKVIARVLRRAADIQAELDEIF